MSLLRVASCGFVFVVAQGLQTAPLPRDPASGQEHRTFVITVDEQPTLAGIDPLNKLIDRNADDNMIDVTKE